MRRMRVWCPTSLYQKSRAFWRLATLKILAIPPSIAPVFASPDAKIHRPFFCYELMEHHTGRHARDDDSCHFSEAD